MLSSDRNVLERAESVSSSLYIYACMVEYSHSKNENYLARYIHFFERQVGMGLNAEEMIIELVRDNRLSGYVTYMCLD